MIEPTGSAREQLRAYVARIERIEEEKQAVAEDLKQVYAEAKSMGFDTKILRTIIRIRKQDDSEREEHEALLATYMIALGMVADAGEAGEMQEAPREAAE
jgi:uncharacterized protein (UPF0335 family)